MDEWRALAGNGCKRSAAVRAFGGRGDKCLLSEIVRLISRLVGKCTLRRERDKAIEIWDVEGRRHYRLYVIVSNGAYLAMSSIPYRKNLSGLIAIGSLIYGALHRRCPLE